MTELTLKSDATARVFREALRAIIQAAIEERGNAADLAEILRQEMTALEPTSMCRANASQGLRGEKC